MEAQSRAEKRRPKIDLKVILWALVAIYTLILPDVIVVYRAIVGFFGQEAAGKVPVLIVAAVGTAYAVAVFRSNRSLKNLLFLVPSGVIAFLIMKLVSNPNKHVHIPEYVLMAWLLFAVLSKDYEGRGILLLVFVYASMLGVVDELEQGIHPARFYGLSDTLVNSASALIGVLTILGLHQIRGTDWAWARRLKDFGAYLWLSLFGLAGAVIICVTLFRVQASGLFWGVYPFWLWLWSVLFLILTPALIAMRQGISRKHPQRAVSQETHFLSPEAKTARLWVFPLLVILLYMHVLALYVSISGVKFN